jgi:hypothetical protein
MSTVGELSDQMWLLREKKRELEAQASAVEKEIAPLELQLLELMKNQGIEMGRGQYATFTRKESVVPVAEDWDAIYKYIARNGYFHLLHKRLSEAACRELFEKNGAIPGMVPFTKVSIRLTTKQDQGAIDG